MVQKAVNSREEQQRTQAGLHDQDADEQRAMSASSLLPPPCTPQTLLLTIGAFLSMSGTITKRMRLPRM